MMKWSNVKDIFSNSFHTERFKAEYTDRVAGPHRHRDWDVDYTNILTGAQRHKD